MISIINIRKADEDIFNISETQGWPNLFIKDTKTERGEGGFTGIHWVRRGAIVCDYHGDIIKEKDGEARLKQYSAPECNYMNLNATKCTFGHSDITSRKQQKAEK